MKILLNKSSHRNLDKCLLIRGYLQSVSINRFCYFPWKHGPKSICAEFVQAVQLVCSRKREFARRGARTHDPGIKSPMLYRLS
ncbi:hypothetical protein T11_2943 [Trichinella zimbabwensis]|uniref:Uncharacterized protein n=1 Tax=Trichinella zimbabwensis TaxID=268475 RepID=A0A0V1HN29_9BILA|nr:hypothetical protein T11_2943 [Trichinella zimbabwensis]